MCDSIALRGRLTQSIDADERSGTAVAVSLLLVFRCYCSVATAADESTAVVTVVANAADPELFCCWCAADPDHHRWSGSSLSLLLFRCCNQRPLADADAPAVVADAGCWSGTELCLLMLLIGIMTNQLVLGGRRSINQCFAVGKAKRIGVLPLLRTASMRLH